MKTCPVCRSRCFDDMPVCYGCLHDFERGILIKDAVDNVDKDAEDMPEEAVLPKPPSCSYAASSALQVLEESDRPHEVADASNGTSTPGTAAVKPPSLSIAGGHSFGVSGSDAAENKSRSSAFNNASPWLAIETNEGYRLVFRFESG